MFADFEQIAVGDTRTLTRTITEADVRRFVELTGDDNPLHVDRSFAEATSFKDIVVHGMLGASFISTVIGTSLPGPGALWLAQNMEFLLPVRLGDELTVICTVLRKHARERLLELETKILNQNGQVVLAGQGKVKVLAERVAKPADEPGGQSRVAVVTGGSGGIGAAVCRRLAADGFKIAINYIARKDKAEALAAELNRETRCAIAVQADVSREGEAERLVESALRSLGPVGVLVNNASGRINGKPFGSTEWGDFQSHLDVQLKGAFLMAKTCLPGMVDRKWGRIVNITSQAADGPPTVGWTAYAAAKAALASMSRYLAAEFGPHGITVNCVSPGMTETALIGDIPEKVQMLVARQTPLRRLATPDDVAATVAHLVSDGGAFVTGQTLKVNGGHGI